MSKNYFSIKTGHEASDKYFKFAPIWHDSDIIKAWAIKSMNAGSFKSEQKSYLAYHRKYIYLDKDL